MKTAEEIRKDFISSETKELVKILENLDGKSVVLARTYMTALADKQKLEEQGKLIDAKRCSKKS